MNKDPFFTILVSIPLKPGFAKEFLALLDDLFAAMHSEPTFVNATALQSTDDPDTIVLCETWLDVDNFSTVQMNRPTAPPTRRAYLRSFASRVVSTTSAWRATFRISAWRPAGPTDF
jgi:quinol monooxygenase YgiN